jgi:hypothetical protein
LLYSLLLFHCLLWLLLLQLRLVLPLLPLLLPLMLLLQDHFLQPPQLQVVRERCGVQQVQRCL